MARFKRVDIQPGQPILGFLAGLATQRGLIISDDEQGRLVFRGNEAVGTPVSFLEERQGCALSFAVNESRIFRSVTGTVPAKTRKKKLGARFTVENPHWSQGGVIRDHHFDCPDIEEGELEYAVEAAAGRMFAEVLGGTAELATWKNDQGDLYWPGQTVWAQKEDEYVPVDTEFLIAMTNFRRSSSDGVTAGLNLVLPGVYNGEIPEELPWQQ